MTTDTAALKAQARALRAEIDTENATAKTRWAEFDALRKSATDEGVDFTKNEDAFTKLDEAGKAYDGLRDSIAAKEARWARLLELAGEESPKSVEQRHEEKTDRLEQHMADTFGEAFVKSDVYAELKAGGALDRMELPMGTTKAVDVATRAQLKTLFTTAAGGAALFRNDRKDLLVDIPQPPLNFLDVIPVGTTDSDTVEWVLESTFTNAAAEATEGAAAAESALAYSTVTSPVQEVTHFIPATKKMLADAGQLETLINMRLAYGVRNRLQSQVVNGNGTAPNLRGILNTAGILTQARSTDARADAVHKAITKIRIQAEVEYTPRFIGIHPTDWETVTLEKTSNGDYYFGGPALPAQGKTLWGLTPVISTAVAAGTPFVFDEQQMVLWLREGLSLAMSDSHSTFFIERKVAVLAAMRAAFAVVGPKGVCTVTSF